MADFEQNNRIDTPGDSVHAVNDNLNTRDSGRQELIAGGAWDRLANSSVYKKAATQLQENYYRSATPNDVAIKAYRWGESVGGKLLAQGINNQTPVSPGNTEGLIARNAGGNMGGKLLASRMDAQRRN